ncbi:Putative phospholipid-transporting ATPase C24B11.12c [Serendipita indica DSM 11827]|uniref:Phospholipid-transporting ATPase n=1 Tax=Serendipita indica (strain DSM 11827) TaxID=1109443 RepID=G4TSL3_SERID|nr:Putative phospholipid-transporting ATPase C24B11.12c [Serendipita indica DSM 11827]CCA74306.1 related to DNF2-Non-essential P-type ATPase [Serendipita indica DSM 11827]
MSMNSLFRRANSQQPHRDHGPDDDTDDDDQVDPELRLRTVRTAASTIAESIRSEQRMERRRAKRRRLWGSLKTKKPPSNAGHDSELRLESAAGAAANNKPRRNVYVNCALSPHDMDGYGRPIHNYVRNKVRTTKYTIVTFVPKNLYEQFRRVANLYFLGLVCIQVFPIFGAAAPQIAMVPLLFILTVTALKDGVEDYRRATLDEEVNNSAATKLGDWRNVNLRDDPRPWWQRLLGLNKPGSISKGVRRLREKELEEGAGRIVLSKNLPDDSSEKTGPKDDVHAEIHRARSLEDIQSVHSGELHEYPPIPMDSLSSRVNLADSSSTAVGDPRPRKDSAASSVYPSSNRTGVSIGVVDWTRQTPGTAKWERTLWKKLEVGDIVLLRDNDQIPADIVVLSTSDNDGLCYVETKNLDGETNLKPRKSLLATNSMVSEEDIEHASFLIDSEPPHANLYLYNGVLRYRSRDDQTISPNPTDPIAGTSSKMEPVTINNLLLRGCTVRNTSWIIGVVVFTGADTKIMLNGGDTPSKRSKIEKETNFNVIMNFLILLAMCLSTAIVSGYFETLTNTSAAYYEIGSDPTRSVVLNALITFCSCLIAFQNIVPISLYISIEIVKTIQAYFISQDIDMWYQPYETACVPKTWNISDDLGQIEYIFSDKTGTLTQNVMEFQKCSINGIIYGEGITEAMRGAAKREGRDDLPDPQEQAQQLREMKVGMLDKMAKTFKNRYLQADKMTLVAPNLADHLADKSSPQRQNLIAFFRALAVCHTVLADRPEPHTQPFRLDYKAESPDEAALVAAARDVGFPFVGKSNTSIEIEVMGQPERYVPLRVLEFNSTRKRMSVIVRNPEGKIVLYTKGADSVIYARLAADHDPVLKEATAKDMETFANAGLRTLCIAYRYLSEEEYLNWSRLHDAALNALTDREEEIDKVNEKIEHSLLILGATALEDKLQEGVPEAIETLHKAGIKLWILTGDKLQTAIEIGDCNLLKSDMEIMILAADSLEDARIKVEAGLNKLATILGSPMKKKGQTDSNRQQGCAVVIDGDTLRYALDPSIKPLFLALGTQCDTVVCCRVSPAQKALTVKLVKDGCNAMTLSIGDGANDVAMIQEANIGCGLLGLEGSQAAMSADYAFGQFRFLTKLLLVHGRWSYIRVADMHSNFFYKNVIWTFAMFWFLFYNSFDATYLYEYTFILGYNLFFTSLPVIVLGAFDQDINAKASLAFPQLYARGIKGLEYTRSKFWLYMFDGFYQSVIVYFIPYLSFSGGAQFSWSGRTLDSLADFGTTVAIAAIFSANIFVGLNSKYWTVITWIAVVGSMLLMCVWVVVYSFFESISFNQEAIVLFSTIGFWATVVFSIILALGPRFICKFLVEAYFPADRDIIREAWVVGDLKDQLGIKRRRASRGMTSRTEDASLFRPHNRDASDNSSDHERDGYEPIVSNRSGVSPQPASSNADLAPPSRRQPTAMSYYSASDIPVSEPPAQSDRRPALALHPSSADQRRLSRASPPSPLHLSPNSPTSRSPVMQSSSPTRLSPRQGAMPPPGEYEMTLRPRLHTPEPSGYSHTSQASQASFVTADDGDWESGREDDRTTVRPPVGQAL